MKILFGVLLLLALAALFFLRGRVHGHETRPAAGAPSGEPRVAIGEGFEDFGRKPCLLFGSWPGFRGAGRDNINAEGIPLAARWPACGPRVLWTAEVGEGCGGAAVHEGRVYLSDYDRSTQKELLRCFSLDDGREIWRRSHRLAISINHGYSRTVPAVSDRHVVSIGPRGHVLCVDALSGALRWGLDLARDFGSEIPLWHAGQCALIDDGCAVLAPAGKDAILMGVDCATGRVVWKTPNPGGWRMSHSSVMPLTLNGRKAYVYGAEWGKVVAVSAEAADRGALLWTWPGLGQQVFVPSPLRIGEDQIFLTSLYGAGSVLLRAPGAGAGAKVVASFAPGQGLTCDIHTPVLQEGLLYGVQSGDAGATRHQLVCMDPFQGGRIVWTSGEVRKFSPFGPFLLADGKIILLDDAGWLTLAKAGGAGYEELARFKVPDLRESRAPLALAGGRLILRDDRLMICLDLRD